jgi:hypothetical protein
LHGNKDTWSVVRCPAIELSGNDFSNMGFISNAQNFLLFVYFTIYLNTSLNSTIRQKGV